ncbi:hypothetical protein HNR19_004108 [Nocardioides thalensis]|uniref:Lipoprotein n=1 Tax=Nocardioides thalensis TaxID=1914755 RepID=A0A853C5Q8_9ACTN|nr:hypothetical protein [Nocardioides thalensis]NYJ03410.1 hypothetical protein [Nocardioides thalensis]
MTRFKRPAAAAGAAALLAFSLSACGGGGDGADAPDNASKDEFCESWNNAFENLTNTEEPTDEDFEAFQDAVADLGDVGTPEGISEEQREGFEVFVDAVADASTEDLNSDQIPGVSEDDSAKAEAFVEYAVTECTEVPDADELLEDAPTE